MSQKPDVSETTTSPFPAEQDQPVANKSSSLIVRTSTFSILVFVLCFLLAIFLIPSLSYQINYALVSSSEKAKAQVARELLADMPESTSAVPWVVKSIRPSVVGIHQVVHGHVHEPGGSVREFAFPNNEGSGVIVDPEGYIITNYHVIENAQTLSVFLSDDRQTRNVQVVGFDRDADIAVLKIDLSGLTAMSWGNSDDLETGEPVLAIGNPYGLFQSVTAGIVSAKERYNEDSSYKLHEFLQTDAAVNPGNSGGPLVNLRGELIGINTMIYGEAYQGISFAIPSTLVKRLYEQIRHDGKVTYGWFGISMSPIPVTESTGPGSSRFVGIEVSHVVPGSPAEKAGLKADDVITRWNNQDVRDSRQLYHTIFFTKPGTSITLQVLRNNEPLEFQTVVGERPASPKK